MINLFQPRRPGDPQHIFEWSGVFPLDTGVYTWTMHKGPDPSMDVVLLPLADASRVALEAVQMDAIFLFSGRARTLQSGGILRPEKRLCQLRLTGKTSTFHVHIPVPGSYTLFTQHRPEEFHATLTIKCSPWAVRWVQLWS